MSVTVFYSWQTDAPSGLNRNFIEDAIERAIKRIKADAEVVNSLRGDEMALDKDTKGRSGSPAIADTILEKIDECAVFVPDLTFVAQTDKNRPTPNPNVLIEYGYALKSRGQARIVGVMNMAFGAPSAETLPFNMRHLRWPITYELAEGAEKAEVRKQLVDQLAGAIRAVLETGPVAEAAEAERERVTRWFDDSMERWHELRNTLPEGHGGRMEHGHYAVGYQLIGNFEPLRGVNLRDALRRGQVRHAGRTAFYVSGNDILAPYLYENNVECWLGGAEKDRGAADSDYWRASPKAQFFWLRGYDEDNSVNPEIKGGTIFDISLPTWRLGETLLHSASMAGQFGADQARVVLVAEWVGLKDRRLAAFSNRRRSTHDNYAANQDTFRAELEVQADQINDGLVESVYRTLRPLYEIFDFFNLPRELVSSELAEMTGRHT